MLSLLHEPPCKKLFHNETYTTEETFFARTLNARRVVLAFTLALAQLSDTIFDFSRLCVPILETGRV